MTRRSTLRPALALPLAVALATVSGCQAYPAAMPGLQRTAAQSTAQVDLAAVRALFGRSRQVLSGGFTANDAALPAIARVQLVVTGPGIASPVASAAVALAPAGGSPVNGTLSLNVPVGANRAFALKGLDAEGHVVASAYTLSNVAATPTIALHFDPDTDAAGRTLADLLRDVPSGAVADALVTTDVTAKLKAFVHAFTGYDAATHQYTGVNPQAFNRAYLVGRIAADGLALLNAPAALADSPLAQEAFGRVHVGLVGLDGRTALSLSQSDLSTVRVDIFDPASKAIDAGVTVADPGDFVVEGVTPGDWDVRVRDTREAKAVWGKLHVGTTGSATFQLAPALAAPTDGGAIGSGTETRVAIARDPDAADDALVVWSEKVTTPPAEGSLDPAVSTYKIMGRVVHAGGTQLDAPFEIGTQAATVDLQNCISGSSLMDLSPPRVAVASAGGEYMVTWANSLYNDAVVAQRVSPSGEHLGEPFSFGHSVADNYCDSFDVAEVAVASNGDGYRIAWSDVSHVAKTTDVTLDGAATTFAEAESVPDGGGAGGSVAIAFDAVSDAYLMAWTTDTLGSYHANARYLVPEATSIDLGDANRWSLAIAANSDDGGALIAWQYGNDVKARLAAFDGTAAGAATTIGSGDASNNSSISSGRSSLSLAFAPKAGEEPGHYMVGYMRTREEADISYFDAAIRRVGADLRFDNRGEARLGEGGAAAVAVGPSNVFFAAWPGMDGQLRFNQAP